MPGGISVSQKTVLKNRALLLTHFDYERDCFVCNSHLYVGETTGETALEAQSAFLEMVLSQEHPASGRPPSGRERYAFMLSPQAMRLLHGWMEQDGCNRQQILEKVIFERAGWMYPAPEGRS